MNIENNNNNNNSMNVDSGTKIRSNKRNSRGSEDSFEENSQTKLNDSAKKKHRQSVRFISKFIIYSL